MKKKKCILFLLIASVWINLQAQEQAAQSEINDPAPKKVYLGLGYGFDYGGIGGKLEILPSKHIGLFAGLGYNLLSVGWNLGVACNILPDAKVSPAVSVLYGYNATLQVKNVEEYNMTSYGVTFGSGIDIKLGSSGAKMSINLFIPVRSKKFMDNYEKMKNDSRIEIITDLIPIGFSFGYCFPVK
jgi:hypothetical protein